MAAWLSGYYHGKKDSTTIDKQTFESNLNKPTNFCRTGDNGKILVMQAIERNSGGAKIKRRTPSANKTTGQRLFDAVTCGTRLNRRSR